MSPGQRTAAEWGPGPKGSQWGWRGRVGVGQGSPCQKKPKVGGSACRGAFFHPEASAGLKQEKHDQICVSKAHSGAGSGTTPS